MRYSSVLIILIFFCSTAAAQEKDAPKKKREPVDKVIIDLGYADWLARPQGIEVKPYSNSADINLYFDYPFGASPFGFAWGAGISSRALHINGSIVYRVDAQGNQFTAIEPINGKYRVNKLVLNYVTVPAEFRIRSARKPTFRLFLGGRAGYLIGSHTTYVDKDSKIKVYRIKNLDPFTYGLTARIGIGRIQLTGYYALNETFKKGKGEPGLTPYSIGINIVPFVK
jgi:hypothetical protein